MEIVVTPARSALSWKLDFPEARSSKIRFCLEWYCQIEEFAKLFGARALFEYGITLIVTKYTELFGKIDNHF